jgi:hypothetical protein
MIKFSSIVTASGVLSGCVLLGLGQNHPYVLYIDNKLSNQIAYCYDITDDSCTYIIHGNSSFGLPHIPQGGRKPSDEEKYESFDTAKVKICGKIIDIKHIRKISPILKRNNNRFEVIINERVTDAFCH